MSTIYPTNYKLLSLPLPPQAGLILGASALFLTLIALCYRMISHLQTKDPQTTHHTDPTSPSHELEDPALTYLNNHKLLGEVRIKNKYNNRSYRIIPLNVYEVLNSDEEPERLQDTLAVNKLEVVGETESSTFYARQDDVVVYDDDQKIALAQVYRQEQRWETIYTPPKQSFHLSQNSFLSIYQ